ERSKTARGQREHQAQDVVAAAQKCVPETRSPGIVLASSQTAIVRASRSSITCRQSANACPLLAHSGHSHLTPAIPWRTCSDLHKITVNRSGGDMQRRGSSRKPVKGRGGHVR